MSDKLKDQVLSKSSWTISPLLNVNLSEQKLREPLHRADIDK